MAEQITIDKARYDELLGSEIIQKKLIDSIKFACDKAGGDCWTAEELADEILLLRRQLERNK